MFKGRAEIQWVYTINEKQEGGRSGAERGDEEAFFVPRTPFEESNSE